MFKKITAAILTTALLILLAVPAMAEAPAYTYEAQKLVIPVTFDGSNNADEWADAVKLVINADNAVFQEYGRFQTGPDRVATAQQLSCTYYIKWDETYLYIREERLDVDGLNNPTVDPQGPWMGDGTAFFFADENDMTRADIRWIAYTDETAQKCAIYSQGLDEEVHGSWQCSGSKNGDVYTIQLAMPWSAMGDKLTQEIKEGALFRFCPIITSRGSDDDYGDWDSEVQINFYDGFIKYDLGNSEDPEYYAGIKLVAANYQAPSDDDAGDRPEADEGDAEESKPVTPAKTGDAGILVLMSVMAMASLGVAVVRKKAVK